jgi:protein SCO1/2
MWKLFAISLLGSLLLLGCNQDAAKPQTSAATPSKKQVYSGRGFVKELFLPNAAKIAHEKIPGYMDAMTMKLEVKNTNELTGIKVGDQITFDMVVTSDDGWIENLKRTGVRDETITPTNEVRNFRRVRDVDPLSVGDVMPDYPFVNENGKDLRLSDYKGNAIAITFMFTRCPFPTFCPRMSSNFEKAAEQLAQPGGPTNWHMFSISFDTDVDTPEQLKRYATRYKRDPSKWNFLTGKLIDIDAITEQFGLVFAKRNGTIDHNLRTVIIDAQNRIRQIYIGNEWPVEDFVAEMKKAAAAKQPNK